MCIWLNLQLFWEPTYPIWRPAAILNSKNQDSLYCRIAKCNEYIPMYELKLLRKLVTGTQCRIWRLQWEILTFEHVVYIRPTHSYLSRTYIYTTPHVFILFCMERSPIFSLKFCSIIIIYSKFNQLWYIAVLCCLLCYITLLEFFLYFKFLAYLLKLFCLTTYRWQ